VREAAAGIPAQLSAQFETTAEMDAGGRKTIIDIARRALARFYPKPNVKLDEKAALEGSPGEKR
jgi:hypothetical protein